MPDSITAVHISTRCCYRIQVFPIFRVRCLQSQHHVPPALCWLLSLVGWRHHPGDVGRGGEGGWKGWGGGGSRVHRLDVLDVRDFCFQSRDLRVNRVSIRG